MTDFLSLVARLPIHVLILWIVWLLFTAGLLVYTSRSSREAETSNSGQSIQVTSSPNTNVYQAGRDINLVQDPKAIRSIQSMSIEGRLTGTLKQGVEVPPSEVEFIPVGDAHAYLDGPTGRTRLTFVSPVRFRLLGSDRITAINQFTMDSASVVQNRPIGALAAFEKLSLPILTVVYGSAFDRITLLELTIFVNGEAIWYGSWKYDVPFQQGPRFSVPLDEFTRRVGE